MKQLQKELRHMLHQSDMVGHAFCNFLRAKSKRWHFSAAFTVFTVGGVASGAHEIVHATFDGLDVFTIWSWALTNSEELL